MGRSRLRAPHLTLPWERELSVICRSFLNLGTEFHDCLTRPGPGWPSPGNLGFTRIWGHLGGQAINPKPDDGTRFRGPAAGKTYPAAGHELFMVKKYCQLSGTSGQAPPVGRLVGRSEAASWLKKRPDIASHRLRSNNSQRY
jgi:hypothetical protein